MLGFEKVEWVAACLLQIPCWPSFPGMMFCSRQMRSHFLSSIAQANLLFVVVLDVWRKSGKILDDT